MFLFENVVLLDNLLVEPVRVLHPGNWIGHSLERYVDRKINIDR